jgi:hypothetical protein
MAHQENAAVAGSEQSGTAPRAPYERPTLSELSVGETLGGSVANESEAEVFTFSGGTEIRGSGLDS